MTGPSATQNGEGERVPVDPVDATKRALAAGLALSAALQPEHGR